jgi:hypothetical protein
MTPATTTPAAKRLIEEHEPANLAAFKGKLRALLTEHADVAPELVFHLQRTAGFGRMIGSSGKLPDLHGRGRAAGGNEGEPTACVSPARGRPCRGSAP